MQNIDDSLDNTKEKSTDLSGNTLSISFKRLIHLKITNQGLEWTFSSLASRYPFLIPLISLQQLFSHSSFPSELV